MDVNSGLIIIKLQLDIFRTVDGEKVKIGNIDDSNLILMSGKQVMAFLLSGEPGNHRISKFGVGEGTDFPTTSDAGLTNAYIRYLTAYRFLEDTVVQWDIALVIPAEKELKEAMD